MDIGGVPERRHGFRGHGGRNLRSEVRFLRKRKKVEKCAASLGFVTYRTLGEGWPPVNEDCKEQLVSGGGKREGGTKDK